LVDSITFCTYGIASAAGAASRQRHGFEKENGLPDLEILTAASSALKCHYVDFDLWDAGF